MILSKESLKQAVEDGSLVIKGAADHQYQPASVDLTLADEFLVVDENNLALVDMESPVQYREHNSEFFIVPPKSFVLAKTREYLEVPNGFAAFVEGRSSIGRLGLFIQNAGWIDPGFKGTITLELFNACNVPIRLQAGRRICQLVVQKMDKEVKEGYKGKYLGQIAVTGSRVQKDVEVKKK